MGVGGGVGGGGGGEGGSGTSDESGGSFSAPCFRALRRIDLSGNEGLKKVSGIGRGAAMPALREVVVDRGVRVEEEEEGEGGVRENRGAVEVVEV